MKKLVLAAAFAGAATTAFAEGHGKMAKGDVIMEPVVVVEEAAQSSSSAGLIIPLVVIALLAAAAAD
ncbi:ferrochelatase [Marivita hallyeonensis]|uniref:Ferrochelatase n=1 Tax=Marivita hallyeonensis TaxID=996342 RepID=A0A1M5UBB1_9RHOB|nr:ferrochelatase [Marivita hallyeonensis]SHH60201.1 hypothetical protein SAMN05443551_2563 [Marivita hallyeonensis]